MPCFISNCDKSFLYVCTLKKHIFQNHKNEYNKIIEVYPEKNFNEILKNFPSNKKLDLLNLEALESTKEDSNTNNNKNKNNKNFNMIESNGDFNSSININNINDLNNNNNINTKIKNDVNTKDKQLPQVSFNNLNHKNNIFDNIILNNPSININNNLNNFENLSNNDLIKYLSLLYVREIASQRMIEILIKNQSQNQQVNETQFLNNLRNVGNILSNLYQILKEQTQKEKNFDKK